MPKIEKEETDINQVPLTPWHLSASGMIGIRNTGHKFGYMYRNTG